MNARDGDPLDVTVKPWDHPYEAEADGVCITCGWIGSYAHTPEFYERGWNVLPWRKPARRSSSKAWLLLALGVGAALGFVAGWVAR